ncbi:hypothetical protein IT568_13260 [bacterium]|nr:hypothetical protein [bacterium]
MKTNKKILTLLLCGSLTLTLSAQNQKQQNPAETEIKKIVLEGQEQIKKIQTQIQNLKNRSQEFELQKQIEQIKKNVETEVLKTRLRVAQAKNDLQLVTEIQKALENFSSNQKGETLQTKREIQNQQKSVPTQTETRR